MNDTDLGYNSNTLDYDKKQTEINDKTNELYEKGINADVHLDPLVTLKCYTVSEEDKQQVYDTISKPDDGSGTAYEILEAMLNCYAGRLDGISRPGLLKNVGGLNEPITYCRIQMQPLVRGPPIMGLDEIFGEEAVDSLLSDFSYIPMETPYVCCCHHHGKVGGSKIFLIGNRLKMENLIPEIYDISQIAAMEDICPYQPNCVFKKSYAANGSPDIRLINRPLETAFLVFQKRIDATYGPGTYAQLSEVAEEIVDLTSEMVNGHRAKSGEPVGYR